MGSLFKSKTQTVKQPYEQNPWEPQQDYLKGGFSQASDALSGALGNIGGITDFTADLTGSQDQLLQRLMAQGTTGTDPLATAAIGAGTNAIGSYGTYQSNLGDIYNKASQDPTQSILTNGQAYADDPYLQGQIDAALGDVNKAFQRDQGNINAAATGSGNINSSRAGVLEAIALDDAQDRAASISSTMRGQAYQSGLDRAMATHQQGITNQMAANQGIGGAALDGYNMAASGLGLQSSGLNQAYGAASQYQTQAQNEIEGQVNGAMLPMNLVQQYVQTIGGNYGGTGYNTQSYQQPSIMQTLAGTAATAAGMGWKPFGG